MQQIVQGPQGQSLNSMTVDQLCDLLEEENLPMLIRDQDWILSLKTWDRHRLYGNAQIARLMATNERPVTAVEVEVILALLNRGKASIHFLCLLE